MARIPFSQIPNAPRVAPPTLGARLPGVPGSVMPDLSGAALDDGSIARARGTLARASDSITSAAHRTADAMRGTKQDFIDERPYIREAGAAAFLGEAMNQAGAAMGRFAEGMLIAKDNQDMIRVDTILRNARDQHELEMTENNVSPDQWVPLWNERQNAVLEEINGLNLSGRIKGRVAMDTARFWSEHTNRLAISATKVSQAQARDEAKAGITRAFGDGDYETAEAMIEESANVGLFSEQEAENLRQDLLARRRDNLIQTTIEADPKAVLDEMVAARESGESKYFPWLTPGERMKVESAARSAFRQRQIEASDKLDEAILAGEFTTPEQVRTYAEENDLPETSIAAATKALTLTIAQTPKAQAEYRAARNSLLSEVAAYDPAADPDQKQYWELKDRLRTTLEEGDRREALDELYARRKEGMTPSAQLKSSLFTTIDNLQKQGLLGDTTYDPEKKKVADWDAYMRVEQRGVELKQWVEGLLRENPNITPEEARQKFQQKVGGDAASAASRIFAEPKPRSGRLDWLPRLMLPGFSSTQQKGNEMGILKKGQTMQDKQNEISEQVPDFRDPKDSKSIPASIRYNNPGAMYPGPSSEKFGAVETKIIGGGHKIAVFPDAISGAAAQFDLLYRVYTGKPLKDAIAKWSGGNSVATYLRVIERETGLTGETMLTKQMIQDPKIAVAIAKAMSVQEAGRAYPLSDDQWLAAHRKAFSA